MNTEDESLKAKRRSDDQNPDRQFQPNSIQENKTEAVPKNLLQRIWYDPVGSDVIGAILSALVILIVVISFSSLFSISNRDELIEALRSFLNKEFELWKFILLIAIILFLVWIGRIMRHYFNRRSISEFPYRTEIGYYKFAELHNAMLSTPVLLPHSAMYASTSYPQDILHAFLASMPYFNMEVSMEHPEASRLYFRLGPQLISFGVCEQVVSVNTITNKKERVIRTSPTGFKLYAYLEKYRLYTEYMNEKEAKTTNSGNVKEVKPTNTGNTKSSDANRNQGKESR